MFQSKERPVRIAVLASDGRKYYFLCKKEGEGDMRKNTRMMEFATVVNRLFGLNRDSRRRRLRLRTFAAIPLREDCGIIEWVSSTVSCLYCRCFAGTEDVRRKRSVRCCSG